MFGMLESLAKVAVSIVKTPVSLVADVVTLGGALNDKDQPYTADTLEEIIQNLNDATKPR